MKTKSNIMIVLAVIAVGLISFISLRAAKGDNQSASAVPTVEKGSQTSPVDSNPASVGSTLIPVDEAGAVSSTSGAFVASKNDKKYFPVTC